MPEQFQFELVSPEALVVSKQVALVTVPGTEGDFGVLPGHAPLIAAVRAGVIDVYDQEGTTPEKIFVAGGFAEVTQERCTVLTEEAMPVAKIDRAAAEQQAITLAEDVTLAKTDFERSEAEAKLAVVRAKLEAIAA